MVHESFESACFALCLFKWLCHSLIFFIFLLLLDLLIVVNFVNFIRTIIDFSTFPSQKFLIYFIFSLGFSNTFPRIVVNLIFALYVSHISKATPLLLHHSFWFFLLRFTWRGPFWPPARFRIFFFLFLVHALSIHHSQKIRIFVSQPFQLQFVKLVQVFFLCEFLSHLRCLPRSLLYLLPKLSSIWLKLHIYCF